MAKDTQAKLPDGEELPNTPDLFPDTTLMTFFKAVEDGRWGAAHAGMERLCRKYWPLLYVVARGHGLSREIAEDVVQVCLAEVCTPEKISTFSREKGKFRSFLLTVFKRRGIDEWRKYHDTQMRDRSLEVSISTAQGEALLASLPPHFADVEAAGDYTFAVCAVRSALANLRAEAVAAGRAREQELWEVETFTTARRSQEEQAAARRALAAGLGVHRDTLADRLQLLSVHFKKLMIHEVAEVASDPAECEAEVKYLLASFARGGGDA